MVVLALHYGRGPVSVKYISKRERISADYIEQLFIKLKKYGLIKSIRGPGGGFLLAKPPSKIKIGNIMRCVEESIALAPCIVGESCSDCPLCGRCSAHLFFKRASDRLKEMMESTSLADLCKPR